MDKDVVLSVSSSVESYTSFQTRCQNAKIWMQDQLLNLTYRSEQETTPQRCIFLLEHIQF